MKKLILSFILMLSIFTTLLVPTSIAAASNPDDEIATLRKTIKFVQDIDTETYKRLETAILKKYTDVIRDDWYMSVMIKLVGLSALDGSLNNTLDPTGTVTKAMFIKMFIRAMYGTEGLENITPDFIHWAAKDVKKAENIGILAQGEYTLSNLSDPITRGEMAKIIVRAYRKYETNPLTVEKCKPISKQIKDYDQMTEEQKSNALLVYGSGIISGYPDGRFAPNDNANRAQASAIIIRYLDKSERAKVVIPSTEATREPMILRYDDPNRPMAIEGDTFVKPDGTKVILKIGPSGVLGEEQGCATEIGRIDRGGTPLKHGDLGADEKFLGQPYLVDEKTGEGHYKTEWLDISQSMRRRALDTLGHPQDGTTYGPWLRYSKGTWVWTGPVR